MREEFVKRVLAQETTKRALCREYGISRPTGDKWIARYMAGEVLDDRSRVPKRSPGKTAEDMESRIVRYRQDHPAIGAKKIRRILENQGCQGLPCVSTINRILDRNGLITRQASLAATPGRRFDTKLP